MSDITMTEERLQELITGAVDKAMKSLPAVKTDVQVIQDEADKGFPTPGDFFQAVKSAAFYPSQEDPRLRAIKAQEVKATGLSEGVPADGGYLVSQSISSKWLENMYATGTLLSRITIDPVGPNANGALYNGIAEASRAVGGSRYGGVLGYWIAEGGSITSSKPAFRQVSLKLKKVAALIYATDEQLQDTVNLEAFINRVAPEELRFQTEAAIYEGDGVGKPLGIMNSPCLVSPLRIDANEVDATDLATMWSRRWVGVNDYVWLINQAVVPQLLNLVVGQMPLYLPGNSIAGQPSATIYGRPVMEIEYAAALGTTGDIMLASLSQYQAIQRGGVQAATSIHVQFLTDETAFRFTYRIDGEPLWYSALTPYHGTATVSPFVVLATASA